MMRQAWINTRAAVSVVQQCVLAGVSRATVYAHQQPRLVDGNDFPLSGLIDEEYAPQEVPLGDIRLAHGFAYLVAIIDWYSRRVLSWRISNSIEAVFCVDCLEEALRTHGKPEIFNSDQGSQFTSEAFTGVLRRESVVISMDGRGRVFDNIFVERLWRSVKHEDVYLNGYASMGELMVGLAKYFAFYNGERPHQALGHKTPDVVYRTATGGGAMILDKFGGALEQPPPVPLRSTGGCSSAEASSEATANTKTKATPGQRRPAANEVECAAYTPRNSVLTQGSTLASRPGFAGVSHETRQAVRVSGRFLSFCSD